MGESKRKKQRYREALRNMPTGTTLLISRTCEEQWTGKIMPRGAEAKAASLYGLIKKLVVKHEQKW